MVPLVVTLALPPVNCQSYEWTQKDPNNEAETIIFDAGWLDKLRPEEGSTDYQIGVRNEEFAIQTTRFTVDLQVTNICFDDTNCQITIQVGTNFYHLSDLKKEIPMPDHWLCKIYSNDVSEFTNTSTGDVFQFSTNNLLHLPVWPTNLNPSPWCVGDTTDTSKKDHYTNNNNYGFWSESKPESENKMLEFFKNNPNVTIIMDFDSYRYNGDDGKPFSPNLLNAMVKSGLIHVK